MSDAFFKQYEGLERLGPGEAADVEWAAGLAGLKPNGQVCDAGCGTGGDVPALLAVVPDGHVTAIEAHAPFIDNLVTRLGTRKRLTALTGDMAQPGGPFDLIWSAGALYFLGIEDGLKGWRSSLAPGGAVAFSEPCLFTDTPSQAALDFWDGYPVTDVAGIAAQVTAAGYETLEGKPVSDTAWENYFTPLEARVAELRVGADEVMNAVLDATEAEIAGWRAVRRETGYLLSVVRPV